MHFKWLLSFLWTSLDKNPRKQGFPGSSYGKESIWNVGDMDLVPGSGRSHGERNGSPLQYSCWRIPWTENPGMLQSMELQRVRHDLATNSNNLFFKKFFYYFYCLLSLVYKSLKSLMWLFKFKLIKIENSVPETPSRTP